MNLVFNKKKFLLDNQEIRNNDRLNNLQLKEDLLSKDSSLFQAQATIAELRKELEQTREEVIIQLNFFFSNQNLLYLIFIFRC